MLPAFFIERQFFAGPVRHHIPGEVIRGRAQAPGDKNQIGFGGAKLDPLQHQGAFIRNHQVCLGGHSQIFEFFGNPGGIFVYYLTVGQLGSNAQYSGFHILRSPSKKFKVFHPRICVQNQCRAPC
nr:hypothetical protein [Bdellovibrio bacteriovorus]